MKSFEELEHNVLKWAEETGILSKGNPKTQTNKLFEEGGELAGAIIRNDIDKIKDGIGDVAVVLIILSRMYGTDVTLCLEDVYKIIDAREGEMVDGAFVKQEDLWNR